jgi:hypothetical protein
MTAQIFTLIGVALGALSSYLVTSLNERSRYRRDVATRLQERKFDAYAGYLSDVRQMVAVANRITASLGFHDRTTSPLSQEEGLPILAELTTRRTASSVTAVVVRDLGRVVAGHGGSSVRASHWPGTAATWTNNWESWRDCRDHAGLWNTTTTRQPLLPA